MTTALAQELPVHADMLYRITVDNYHRMLASGMIEEGAPYELLDGHVVRKIRGGTDNPMTINRQHAAAVYRLSKLDAQLNQLGCYMHTQSPISIPPDDEPEPDGAVVRGTVADYVEHHPGPADVLCVIEVADASLSRDRGYKQKLYADSGIETYLIVNLVDRVVEVYTQPMKGKGRYGQSTTLSAKQTVSIPTGSGKPLNVPVKRLFG
jgi:Uma2 family endonuclease